MSKTFHELAQQALALDPRERLQLASELIDSVDGTVDREWADAWSAELDRRVSEANRTGDRGRPWSEVRADILAELAGR